MDITERVIVVTGAGSGIGRAMAERFVAEGAKAVACVDIAAKNVEQTATQIGGKARAYTADVTDEAAIAKLVSQVETDLGPIDIFCSNAGIGISGGVETTNADWEKSWQVNLMSHVYAARTLIPLMTARNGGYLVNTASAAGLLCQIGSASYSVTKHAAVALAEFLAISYGDDGICVSVLCPQAVRTAMTAGTEGGGVAGVDGMLEPEAVAEAVVRAIEEERFLVLPHPEVLTYMQRKTDNYDRWISGMRRLRERYNL